MARSLILSSSLYCVVSAAALALAPAALAGHETSAAGNPAKGAEVFHLCAVCHSIEKGGGDKVGPNLFGVVGRKAGTEPGYHYSSALKNSGIAWTDDKLKEWVSGPQKVVPGTSMALIGTLDSQQADDLVAYLNTQKNTGGLHLQHASAGKHR